MRRNKIFIVRHNVYTNRTCVFSLFLSAFPSCYGSNVVPVKVRLSSFAALGTAWPLQETKFGPYLKGNADGNKDKDGGTIWYTFLFNNKHLVSSHPWKYLVKLLSK